MLSDVSVVRSAGARVLFLVAAIVTAAILLWAHQLALRGQFRGLAPIFFVLFAALDYRAAMWMLLILVAALFWPSRISARPLLRWVGEHPGLVAGGCLIGFSVGALVVYRNHPLSMDEYAALFQSQAFAAGHLTGQFPAPLLDWLIPHAFQNYFLNVSHSTGQVASSYWPSFSLLLTPFTWLGIPWACNAVISALTVLAIHRLALQILETREAAGLAVLLTIASPVFFADGISYYSMAAHLLANTLFALLLIEPTPRKALVAGFVGSIALTLHNPVPHLLFAVPWLVWLPTRARGIRLLAYLGAGYAPLCVLLGVGWFWFLGGLAHDGIASTVSSNGLGDLSRLSSAYALPTSTLFLARLIGVAKIWLWAVPALLLLACVGAWKWRHNVHCRLLAAAALTTLIGYLFVPVDQGHGWGFRYFHSAWVALPVLGAAALSRLPASVTSNRMFEDEDTLTFVTACAVLTLLAGIGFRANQIHEFISADLEQVPAYAGTEWRVMFIDPSDSFYGSDLVQNDPLLRGSVIRLLSHGPTDDAAMMREHFPALHQVYADRFGTVWSAAPAQAASTTRPQ